MKRWAQKFCNSLLDPNYIRKREFPLRWDLPQNLCEYYWILLANKRIQAVTFKSVRTKLEEIW